MTFNGSCLYVTYAKCIQEAKFIGLLFIFVVSSKCIMSALFKKIFKESNPRSSKNNNNKYM